MNPKGCGPLSPGLPARTSTIKAPGYIKSRGYFYGYSPKEMAGTQAIDLAVYTFQKFGLRFRYVTDLGISAALNLIALFDDQMRCRVTPGPSRSVKIELPDGVAVHCHHSGRYEICAGEHSITAQSPSIALKILKLN